MKNALIWGAGGGIGTAIASLLAKDGWQILAAGRHVETLTGLVSSVYNVDVGDAFSVQAAVSSISQQASEVDLWVYAAGDITSMKINKMSPLEWQRILQANLGGPYLTTHYSWPLLTEQSHLFYMGAVSERLRIPGLAAYAAAKAGLEAFAETVRKESRCKVTVIRPVAVDTGFWQKVPFRLPAHPLKPDEVAARIFQAYEEGKQGLLDL